MDDGLLDVTVADVGPRRRGRAASSKKYGDGEAFLPATYSTATSPSSSRSPQASFGSSARACEAIASRTAAGITTRRSVSIDSATSLGGCLPEVGAEVLPAAVGEDRDDDALVELVGEPARDVDDGAGRDTAEDPLEAQELAHRGDRLLVRDEHLPVELRDVEDRRHVAVVERPEAHHRVAGQRLGGGDGDVRERLAQRSPAPISVPPVPRPATSTSTRSSASAISAPVPS